VKLTMKFLLATALYAVPTVALDPLTVVAVLKVLVPRVSELSELSVGSFNGVYWSSFESEADLAAQGSASASGLFGAAYTLPFTKPGAFVAYFDAAADWGYDKSDFSADAVFTGEAAFVGTTYFSVSEINAAGDNVKEITLDRLKWDKEVTQVLDAEKNLRAVTFVGTKPAVVLGPSIGDFTFTMRVVYTDTGVKLSNGRSASPESMTTAIEFTGWEYENAANVLQLKIGVVQASGKLGAEVGASADYNLKGVVGVAMGDTDATKVFFDLDGDVTTDSGKQPGGAKVSFDASGVAAASNSAISAQVTAAAGGAANVVAKIAKVTFPAGATTVSYEGGVTQGHGQPPEMLTDGTNAAPACQPNLIGFVIAAMVVLASQGSCDRRR
jgi:hypothetical protein